VPGDAEARAAVLAGRARARRRRRAVAGVLSALALVGAGQWWAGTQDTSAVALEQSADEPVDQPVDGGSEAGARAPETAGDAPAPAPEAVPPEEPVAVPAPGDRTPTGEPVTLAFGGDVHAEGGSGAALAAGLPTFRAQLSAPDLTVVNLETAITERGTAAPKQFAFRAPESVLTRLKEAGVDVVTVANNHGLDYGQQGLSDTLSAGARAGMPMVGIGTDAAAAHAPHVAEVRGQRIAVLGATQVLDSSLEQAWTAGDDSPGMASAKQPERLLAEVARVRTEVDTVVVFLHWGEERNPCPLPRQQELARQLVDAGADVVVGSHAHVLLGGGYLDGAYVDYGLGNFVFAGRSAESRRTGLLTLTLQGRAVTDAVWTPAVVQDGAPVALEGQAAVDAVADKAARRGCTDLAAAP
jgi:poly-gamma-glutamate synthesis protein (capsule biosynthesis protein)